MKRQKDLSRREILKTMLWTPPALMFASGGLFAADQDIRPLYAPRLIDKNQKIRLAQIGVLIAAVSCWMRLKDTPSRLSMWRLRMSCLPLMISR